MTALTETPSGAGDIRYRRYVLGLLMVVGLFNYIDRLCMSILVVPVREDLGLSDTQIGVLTGLAFSLVYTLMAVPIARLADLTSRKLVIAGALGVWSLMTAFCGFAGGFWTLAFLRMGVAIGEAGCVPATQALISDYFPVQQRARAIATWQLVFPVGTLIGIAGSGWLSQEFGWRNTFILLGVLGLCLVPLVLLTLKEPRRGAADGIEATAEAIPVSGLLDSFSMLWSLRAYRYLLIGGALIAYPLNVTLFWNAQFYSRVFDLPLAELAWKLALLSGGAGAIGLFLGGFLADRLGKIDARWYMLVPGIAGIAVAPMMIAQYFSASAWVSLAFGVFPVMLMNAFMPPQAAAAQTLVAPGYRALAAATIVLVAGFVGTALGPFFTGVISDLLFQATGNGDESLRLAIASSAIFAAVGGAFFLRAAKYYPAEAARVAAP